MRKVDENRARGYIKKHERYKKWLAFALCIALITGTGTFYMMNKPATAMTEDGAEQIGVVLEGAEAEVEQGTIQQEENNEASAEAGSTVADTSSVLDTVLSGEGSVELNGIADSLTNSEGAVTGDSGVAASHASSADDSNAAATLASSADESNAAANLASSVDDSNAAASLASLADDSNAAASLASSLDENAAAAASSGASLSEAEKTELVLALDVPEKVDVTEYVTSTVIERRLADGSWEVIQKEDVAEGDYIRITYNYDIPDEAKLSEDIQLPIPEELDFVDIEKATLLDGSGTAELTEDNQIKIEYSEEVKEEIILNNTEEIVVETQDATEVTSEDAATAGTSAEPAAGTTTEPATEGTSTEPATEGTVNTSDRQASNPVRNYFAGLFGRSSLGSFFSIFAPLKVYAAGEGVSYEGYVSSLPGMKITGVSVTKNPISKYEGGQIIYYGGTPVVNAETEVGDGERLLFQLNYRLEKKTITVSNPIVTYDLKGHGINVSDPLSGDVTNNNNEIVGAYTVGTDGIVTITFKPEFAAKNSEHPIEDGSFFFVMMANKSSEETYEYVEYDFGDNVKFTVKIIKADLYDLSLEKKASDFNAADKTIDYEIIVRTNNGSGKDGIKLTDFFKIYNTGYSSYSENTELTAKMIQDQNTVTGLTITKSDETTYNVREVVHNQGTEMYIDLPDLAQNEYYTIKYTYKLPDEVANTTSQIKVDNGVKAKYNNDKETEYHVGTDIKGRVPDINKGALLKSAEERIVTWTITLNTSKYNLKDYTLTDNKIVLAENGWSQLKIPYTGKLKVVSVDGDENGVGECLRAGQEIELGQNGYKFNADDYHTYVFTYDQKFSGLDLMWGNLLNEAVIYKEPDGNNSVSGIYVGENNVVEKTGDGITVDENNPDLANVKWIVTIHGPITPDQGTDNSEYWTFGDAIQDSYQVITDGQMAEFERILSEALQGVNYYGRYVVERGERASITRDGVTIVEGYKNFTVKFYDKLENHELVLAYYTTGYIGDGAKTYKNKAYVRNINYYSEDSQGFEPMIAKYDVNGNHDTKSYDYYSDTMLRKGILTWRVRVNIPENCKYPELEVTDTLPDGVELIDTVTFKGATAYGLEVADNDSFQGAVAFAGGSANYLGTDFTETVSGKNVVVKFRSENVQGKSLYFRIRAQITDTDWSGATDGKKLFTNGVSLKDGGGVDLGTDSQTTEVTKTETALRKSATTEGLNAHDTIEYTLDINENAADLLTDGDELTLTDTLTAKSPNQFGSLLLSDSIHVYEVITDENGNEIETALSTSQYSYHVSEYETTAARYNDNGDALYILFSVIEFKLPDQKHIRIKYRYTFNGDKDINIEVSNEAVLKGIAIEKSTDSKKVDLKIEDAGAKANIKGIDILKVDNDNQAVALSGAEFALYRWNGTNTNTPWERVFYNETAKAWEVVADVTDAYVYTSGEDGKVPIDNLVYNQVYKVVETKAPDKYMLKSKPMYFYMPSTDTQHYPRVIPDQAYTGGEVVSAINQGANAVFTNTKNTTFIDIEKYWDNADETMPDSITVKIGRRLGSETDEVKDSYWSLHVDQRNGQNTIVNYKGYPSLKDGTKVTISFDSVLYENATTFTSPVYVKINGVEQDISSWPRSGSGNLQTMTYEFEIHQDTSFVIKNGYGGARDTVDVVIGDAPSQSSSGNEQALQKEEPDYMTVTLTGPDWKKRVDNLERYYLVTKEDGSFERYLWLYYISEVNSVYYTASYSDNNKTGINSGTLTLTNTRNDVQPYVLPSTGGIGDDPIKAAGLGFMGLALIGSGAYFYSRRRRKKKFSKV